MTTATHISTDTTPGIAATKAPGSTAPLPPTAPISQMLLRYERIMEISQQLSATRDHAALLRQIVDAARELIDTDAASILLIDPASGELRFEMASNLDQHTMDQLVVPLEGSIAGWVVTHGEPRVIHDVRQEPNFFPQVDDEVQFTTRSLLAVPLRSRQRVIGALEAVNKRGGISFTGEDVQLLTTLGGQAASAIENMRLFQQSDFMAEMVHELRTPLAALKTSVTLLRRPGLAEAMRQDITETMSEEIERLIGMTNDFLDLARLESGRMKIEPTAFSLEGLAADCVQIVSPQAADRAVRLFTPEQPMPAVFADRNKIKQVLLNLLTNAVKYNRVGGTVSLSAQAESRADGTPMVRVEVSDTGLGISREAQKSMFQKFYRVPETANEVQGTGLGLAIVKYIVEAHRGAIGLESEPGAGSTFWFTLPAAP